MPAPIIPAPSTPTLVALNGGTPCGAELAGVDRLQVEEERLDHVLRLLVDDQVGQVARLDPRRGVEVAWPPPRRPRTGSPAARGRPRPWSACAAGPGRRAGTPPARGSSGCRRASCSPGGPTGSSRRPRRRGARGSTPSRRAAGPRGVPTSSSTRPFSCAAAGLKRVPWSSTSIRPSWMPSIRTMRVTPPPPGSSPRLASGRPSSTLGSSSAIRWLAARAISKPPPSAAPLIAATTGRG